MDAIVQERTLQHWPQEEGNDSGRSFPWFWFSPFFQQSAQREKRSLKWGLNESRFYFSDVSLF